MIQYITSYLYFYVPTRAPSQVNNLELHIFMIYIHNEVQLEEEVALHTTAEDSSK